MMMPTFDKTFAHFTPRGTNAERKSQQQLLDELKKELEELKKKSPHHKGVRPEVTLGFFIWHMFLLRTPGLSSYRLECLCWNFCREEQFEAALAPK